MTQYMTPLDLFKSLERTAQQVVQGEYFAPSGHEANRARYAYLKGAVLAVMYNVLPPAEPGQFLRLTQKGFPFPCSNTGGPELKPGTSYEIKLVLLEEDSEATNAQNGAPTGLQWTVELRGEEYHRYRYPFLSFELVNEEK